MALIRYDAWEYSHMHDMASEDVSAGDNTPHDSDKSTISDDSQNLLQAVRKSNEMDKDRMPLDDFLALIQQQNGKQAAAQSEQIKFSVSELVCDMLCNVVNKPGVFLDQGTQTNPRPKRSLHTSSQAAQTEFQSGSFEELLKRARDDAYHCGLRDGKEEGLREVETKGRRMGKSEGSVVGKMLGRADGFEDAVEFDLRRGDEVEKQLGMDESLAEEALRPKEEIRGKVTKKASVRDKLVVEGSKDINGVTPEKPLTTMDPANDPFRSLLATVKNKRALEF